MAGVKGRSGGARPGAGRKPKPPALNDKRDALEFLLSVMLGEIDPNASQLKAAIAAARYLHPVGGGKND